MGENVLYPNIATYPNLCTPYQQGKINEQIDASSSLNRQVQGRHYKDFKIQPVQFIHANNIGFIEGNIIKYICRWRAKGGIQDLEKVKHYVEMLIELERGKHS